MANTNRCPIRGCKHMFNEHWMGFASHARSLKAHPNWHPDVVDADERAELAQEEFPEQYRDPKESQAERLRRHRVKKAVVEKERRTKSGEATLANFGRSSPPAPMTVGHLRQLASAGVFFMIIDPATRRPVGSVEGDENGWVWEDSRTGERSEESYATPGDASNAFLLRGTAGVQ